MSDTALSWPGLQFFSDDACSTPIAWKEGGSILASLLAGTARTELLFDNVTTSFRASAAIVR
jgi:hypothetical protein